MSKLEEGTPEGDNDIDLVYCTHIIHNYDYCPFLNAVEPRDCNDCKWQKDLKDK
jgi:hypothetical protein